MIAKLQDIGKSLLEILLYGTTLSICYALAMSLLVMTGLAQSDKLHTILIVDPYHTTLVRYLPLALSSIIAVLIVHQVIFRRPLSFSGFTQYDIPRQLLIGSIWSVTILLIGYITLYSLGWIELRNAEMNMSQLLGFFILFIFQSTFEEVTMRSFLLPTLSYRLSIWSGLWLSSILFALLHYDNAHTNWLSFLNLCMAGALLGSLYIRYQQIWAPIGLHMMWNFFQGPILGFKVSGLEMYSFLDTDATGPDLWTGGEFGFEASIIATLMLGITTYLIWIQAPQHFKGKLLILTNEQDDAEKPKG